jgi:hypothetical protein
VVADAPAPVCELSSFERLGVWCGLVGCILAFAGILIAHLFPPPSPDETAEQVAHFYRTYTTEVRWGTIIAAYGSALLAPWFGVMVVRMRQFPGYGRAMAYCQAGLAAVLILEFIYPLVMLQVVVFRPDRPAAETLTLSDFALIFFIAPG